MARNHNSVTLMGWLLRDPSLFSTKAGCAVARGGISSPRYWMTRDGERRVDKCWIDFVVFGPSAEDLVLIAKKGDVMLVSGWLKLEEWERPDGTTKYTHLIIAREWKFVMCDEDNRAIMDKDRKHRDSVAANRMIERTKAKMNRKTDEEPDAKEVL